MRLLFLMERNSVMYLRILQLLNTGEYTIMFDLDIRAAGVIEDNVIKINPMLGDRVVTLIHECIHELELDWCEDDVEMASATCYRRLTYEYEQILLYYIRELRK